MVQMTQEYQHNGVRAILTLKKHCKSLFMPNNCVLNGKSDMQHLT